MSQPILPYGRQTIDDDDIAAVSQVLRSDFLATGPTVEAFEVAFAEVVGAHHAVACSNGTAALHLAMLALDVKPGEVVIAPSITFLATANCARYVGADVVFAVIIGTGCGGGIAIDGRPVAGRNLIAGEWGHTPLPWPRSEELPGPVRWCGRRNCLELWLSGTGFARDTGMSAEDAVATSNVASLDRYIDRLGRALAVVVDLLDPDMIVLGGGMSNIASLYEGLPGAISPHVFSDVFTTPVVKALHGDSSGVRGAAWLWPLEPDG